VRWVRAAWARHQPEAELMAALLAQLEIPVYIRRGPGVDVPDMLAGGGRELMVPADRVLEARALLDPSLPLEDAGGEDRPSDEGAAPPSAPDSRA
jgi:hypothetical protein